MELIDIFNPDMTPNNAGPVTIDVVHQKGLWHQTIACWVYNTEKKVIYLQLRGPKNRVGPNTFDASAGGHLSAGEKPSQGIREVTEELGNILLSNLMLQGIFKNVYHKDFYFNNEFCHIFTAETRASLDEMKLQKGEVGGIFELPFFQVNPLLSGKTIPITGKIFSGETITRSLHRTDLNLFNDRMEYYTHILQFISKIEKNGGNLSKND